MSNSETKALHEISEKFMLGSLLKLMIGEIKLQSVPWGALPENEQQIVINRVTARCEKAIRETVLRGAASSRLALYHHVVRRRVAPAAISVLSASARRSTRTRCACSSGAPERSKAGSATRGAFCTRPISKSAIGMCSNRIAK